MKSKLFTSCKIGDLELKNRIIRAGCFEGMCQNKSPTAELLNHHKNVASGGVAMTTLAYASVSPTGLAFEHELLMRPDIVPGLKNITAAIHAENAAVSIQLGHCGFFSSPSVIGQRPLGPSTKFCTFRMSVSKKMTLDDMDQVRNDFGNAALLAKEAGFDAIELHSGHGYLLSQFLSPWTNKRKDDFGGSLFNRLRFPVSVLTHVREKVGPDFPILIKMNLYDGFSGGLTLNEAIQIAGAYEKAGASALIASCGFTSKTPLYMLRGRVPIKEFAESETNLFMKFGLISFGKLFVQHFPFTEMFLLDDAKKLREAVSLPLVLIGGICSRENIETALEEGFDFVQIGRATIRDPNFVNKLKAGIITRSDCDHCNRCVGEMAKGGVHCKCLEEGRELQDT
jgi:2,4-dienoyl-CoA reductase-like NADH-dependent reductase (Old Yellow Enzyme family)